MRTRVPDEMGGSDVLGQLVGMLTLLHFNVHIFGYSGWHETDFEVDVNALQVVDLKAFQVAGESET